MSSTHCLELTVQLTLSLLALDSRRFWIHTLVTSTQQNIPQQITSCGPDLSDLLSSSEFFRVTS